MVADLLGSVLAMGWMVTNEIKDKTGDQGRGKKESGGLRPTELSRESSWEFQGRVFRQREGPPQGPEVAGKNDFR